MKPENDFETEQRTLELERVNDQLRRQLKDAKNREQRLVDATLAGAKAAMLSTPIRPVRVPERDWRKGSPLVALWDLGDWQGSKLTPTYNSEVMAQRVDLYCQLAGKITKIHRQAYPVRDCVIIFGGDMVEGLFNFPTQPFEIDATIFEQFTIVSRLLVDVVRKALRLYRHVTIVPEWGNHGRIGSKRDNVPRSDNIDRMCYELARQLLEDQDRLLWPDCSEDIQRLEIGSYRAVVLHGDEPGRTGFVSPSTMVQYITRLQSGAYGWDFRDAYVHHYHNHSEYALPNGRGSVFYNGSTESDNRYARDGMGQAAIPSQRLHFIDPQAGRVASVHKVWLSDDRTTAH